MKRTLFSLVAATAMLPLAAQEWTDASIFAQGKEEGHATYTPYQSTEAMRADAEYYAKPWLNPTGNTRWMSLDGTWQIQWQNSTSNMPNMANLTASVTPPRTAKLTDVKVPGCLEMQGYGTPYYINDNYAFFDYQPNIFMQSGVENGVGSYRCTFTVPSQWNGERVYLHFDGIYGGAYVWLNGKKVGYTQGSNNDAEFDITPYLTQGTNVLGVQNIRWTDGSYLEGQDMWHMSGIHRNVYLYALPEGSVRDHALSATFSEDLTSATLHVSTKAGKTVKVSLFSPEGKLLTSTSTEATAKGVYEATLDVPDVQLWSAENPVLYTVEFSQCDAKGKEEMAFSTKYGFREITNDGKLIRINGQRVYFRGVNTQDTDPMEGRTMPLSTMLQDIILMKQANVNTVRTSHYPRSPRMMAMFDYYGLYVMDEADNECHHNWTDNGINGISSDPDWLPAMQDRTDRMVLRDRNHPSVIFWSTGNESCWGENFQKLYDAVKTLDGQSGRPVHYEGGTRGGAEGETDLFSQMYPTVNKVKNNSTSCSQPYFICEYAHAMGNAIGNLREYWDAIYHSNYGVGGCIWDWVDQSIYDAQDIKDNNLVTNGLPRFKSGYDYGRLHQNNFVNNGILTADRKPAGKYVEVKAVYQPVQRTSSTVLSNTLKLYNVDSFTDLNAYDCHFDILINGEVVETGRIDLPSIPAQNSTPVSVTIPFTTPKPTNQEMLANVYFTLREATPWAEAGHVVASFQQMLVRRASTLPTISPKGAEMSITQTGAKQHIGNADFDVVFLSDGTLFSYQYKGKELITEGLEYDNFRWIENDQYKDTGNGISDKTATFTLADDKQSASVRVSARGSLCSYTLLYTIYANGTFDAKITLTPQKDDLRRLGMAMAFAPGLENVKYWGRGPEENYSDRKTGTFIGRYSTTVDDLFENYPHPQTSGGREDIREVILANDEGKGLRITTAHASARQVAMQLSHFKDTDMTTTALHPYDLMAADDIYAHFDIYQRGLGNGSCGQGTGTISEYYCPSSGSQVYTLRFAPYDEATEGIGSVIRPAASPTADKQPTAYDIMGRRLAHPQRGITLMQGRKTFNQYNK